MMGYDSYDMGTTFLSVTQVRLTSMELIGGGGVIVRLGIVEVDMLYVLAPNLHSNH